MIKKYLNSGDPDIQYALAEFRLVGWMDKDGVFKEPMQELMCLDLLEIIETIARQNHSGFSYGYLIALLIPLLYAMPITLLQGTDDEWENKDPSVFSHNERCWDVKRGDSYRFDGQPYDDNTKSPVVFPYDPYLSVLKKEVEERSRLQEESREARKREE
ncbi:MAG: hypothetical protein LBS53_08940 [Synergistaceae bacterium]|jgi:hypothetical protein|nr:hypothetical protein [Synergistaceae bacterium]